MALLYGQPSLPEISWRWKECNVELRSLLQNVKMTTILATLSLICCPWNIDYFFSMCYFFKKFWMAMLTLKSLQLYNLTLILLGTLWERKMDLLSRRIMPTQTLSSLVFLIALLICGIPSHFQLDQCLVSQVLSVAWETSSWITHSHIF